MMTQACAAAAAKQSLPADVCVPYCQQLQDTQVYMGVSSCPPSLMTSCPRVLVSGP